jgi:transcriptional regulator with XRE-family HTH domain
MGYRCVVTDVEPHEALAANLHRLAFTRGITLESVARAVGISLDDLLAICTGEADPDLDIVTRIAQAVGVRLSELFADPTYN